MRRLRGSRIAIVFQNPRDRLDPALSIESQLVEVLLLHAVSRTRAAARGRSLELLNEVQIYEPERVLKSHPHELSGGLLQRVMIAMALSGGPDILIADEPTSSLDVTIQSEILELLATLQRARGMSVLFITHDIQVARQVADSVAIMYGGQIVEQGRAEEVLDRPLHPYTQALLACVPRTVNEAGRLNTIAGQPLNLRELPTGCRFAPRCPYVQERCLRAMPELITVKGRRARCVLYEESP
jgi:oligopeptide/dipeptide ABC transporter ATP-binding protein